MSIIRNGCVALSILRVKGPCPDQAQDRRGHTASQPYIHMQSGLISSDAPLRQDILKDMEEKAVCQKPTRVYRRTNDGSGCDSQSPCRFISLYS